MFFAGPSAPGDPTTPGPPNTESAGWSVGAHSVGGQSGGQPVGGQPVGGQPVGGHSALPPPDPRQVWRPLPAQPTPSRTRATPDRELRHRSLAALTFGMLALIGLLGIGSDLHRGVWALIFSAAVGLAACVIGITALAKARRTGAYRPRGAIGGIVLGALAALLSVPLLVFYLMFPRQLENYVTCASQAQTSAQLQACTNELTRSAPLGAVSPVAASPPTGSAGPGPAAPTVRPLAVPVARPGRRSARPLPTGP